MRFRRRLRSPRLRAEAGTLPQFSPGQQRPGRSSSDCSRLWTEAEVCLIIAISDCVQTIAGIRTKVLWLQLVSLRQESRSGR